MFIFSLRSRRTHSSHYPVLQLCPVRSTWPFATWILSTMRGNKNKLDFTLILNACIYQSLDPYNSKTKHLRYEWHINTEVTWGCGIRICHEKYQIALDPATAILQKILKLYYIWHRFVQWYLVELPTQFKYKDLLPNAQYVIKLFLISAQYIVYWVSRRLLLPEFCCLWKKWQYFIVTTARHESHYVNN